MKPALAAGGAIGVALAAQAVAQGMAQPPAGLRAELGYSAGLEVDSNYRLRDPSEGTYAAFVNALDLAILSNTRTQTFALTFGSQIPLVSDPEPGGDDDFEWRAPTVTLAYTREAASARLALSTRLETRQVDSVEPYFIDANGDTIVDEVGLRETTGTVTNLGATVSLATGINAPIGTTYTARYQSRTYSDTLDSAAYDRTSYRLATATRLRLSDVTTGSVDLSASQYEYSKGRDLTGESYSISLGLEHEFSRTLSANVSLGYSKVHEEEIVEGETLTRNDQGPLIAARLAKEVQDGSYFLRYNRNLIENTFRNTLTFGRTLSMPHYELTASVGLTNLDGEDPAANFAVAYSRPLPDGSFSAALRRGVTVTTEDEERTLTTASFAYSHQITELSSFSLGFDYSVVSSVGDTGDSGDRRAALTAQYTHALTEDWDLSVGYRGRTRSEDSEDAVSNAVFLNIGRDFVFRP